MSLARLEDGRTGSPLCSTEVNFCSRENELRQVGGRLRRSVVQKWDLCSKEYELGQVRGRIRRSGVRKWYFCSKETELGKVGGRPRRSVNDGILTGQQVLNMCISDVPKISDSIIKN